MSEAKEAVRKPAAEKNEHTPPVDGAGAPPPAAPPAPPAPKEEPRPPRPLPLTALTKINMSEGEFGNVWGVKVPAGTPMEDMLNDVFWSSICMQWSAYDEVRVIHADHSYYDTFLVRSVRTVGSSTVRNRASVQLVSRIELKPVVGAIDLSGFECRWMGRDKKWCVMRSSDGAFVSEGFATPQDASTARIQAAFIAQRPRG